MHLESQRLPMSLSRTQIRFQQAVLMFKAQKAQK
jgi:hypothetical protein